MGLSALSVTQLGRPKRLFSEEIREGPGQVQPSQTLEKEELTLRVQLKPHRIACWRDLEIGDTHPRSESLQNIPELAFDCGLEPHRRHGCIKIKSPVQALGLDLHCIATTSAAEHPKVAVAGDILLEDRRAHAERIVIAEMVVGHSQAEQPATRGAVHRFDHRWTR